MSGKTAEQHATTAMAKLRAEGIVCTRCDLYVSRTQVVPGAGASDAGP